MTVTKYAQVVILYLQSTRLDIPKDVLLVLLMINYLQEIRYLLAVRVELIFKDGRPVTHLIVVEINFLFTHPDEISSR